MNDNLYIIRLRQGNETEVEFLVSILPGLIVDFLPRMDGMNMVVSEVISQQQSRPWLAATVMSKVRHVSASAIYTACCLYIVDL